jgi:hypothetical protein
MGKKTSDGEKLLGAALIALGLFGLYYLTAGAGRENNAALIPDKIEDRIDGVIDALNARVGKNWGGRALAVLKYLLRGALSAPLVALVDVVYTVEQEARSGLIPSYAKRQRAVVRATTLGLA